MLLDYATLIASAVQTPTDRFACLLLKLCSLKLSFELNGHIMSRVRLLLHFMTTNPFQPPRYPAL